MQCRLVTIGRADNDYLKANLTLHCLRRLTRLLLPPTSKVRSVCTGTERGEEQLVPYLPSVAVRRCDGLIAPGSWDQVQGGGQARWILVDRGENAMALLPVFAFFQGRD